MAILAATVSVGAQAAPILDQESIGPSSGIQFFTSSGTFLRVQTVTVGIDGLLATLEVHVSGTPVSVNIRSTVAGVPDAIVGSADLTGMSSGYGVFDLSGLGLSFSVGDIFGFEVLGGSTLGSSSNDYAAGADFYSNNSGATFAQQGGYDTFFRTFVEAGDEVPAPAALLLIGFGLAGLGVAGRRRTA